MHFFEFAQKDSTLYEGQATQSVNTGLDEILEKIWMTLVRP